MLKQAIKSYLRLSLKQHELDLIVDLRNVRLVEIMEGPDDRASHSAIKITYADESAAIVIYKEDDKFQDAVPIIFDMITKAITGE